MKAMFSKSVLAGAVAVASLFAGANAQAQNYPDFTVQKPGTTGTANQFTADKIVSNYIERISFLDENNDGSGTFTVNLFFDLEGFAKNNGATPLDNTGLNAAYDLYGFYTATGTFAPNSTMTGTTFTFLPGAGSSLSLWLDRQNNTMASAGTDGVMMGDYINRGDDELLATGVGVRGEGNLTPFTENCLDEIECGSFGSVTTFNLVNQGTRVFIAPSPFYTISLQRGQLNNFPVTGTQIINGSMDITFREPGRVPEPASLGLLGLGLLGLGAARRRKQAK